MVVACFKVNAAPTGSRVSIKEVRLTELMAA